MMAKLSEALALLVVGIVTVVAPAGGLHVVAQVVEAELAVGAVGDVAIVGLAAFGDGVHVALDVAGGDAEGPVNGQHPLAVTAGEVVVDGDDVDALAFQAVEEGRQRGDEGLAFAGDHFGDVAAVQDDAAEHLHVEVAHVLGAPGGLPAGGERLGEQVVQEFAVGQALAELGRGLAQLLVALGAHLLFEVVDLGQERAGHDRMGGAGLVGPDVTELADIALIAGAEQAREEPADLFGEARQAVTQFFPEGRLNLRFGRHCHLASSQSTHRRPCRAVLGLPLLSA